MPRLPLQLLKDRIDLEVEQCIDELSALAEISKLRSRQEFPVQLVVRLTDLPAPAKTTCDQKNIVYRTDHEFIITIDRSYPFRVPEVIWRTEIFHPNIAPPGEGGRVCCNKFHESIGSMMIRNMIESMILLLGEPNSVEPLDTPTCTRAAEYYNRRHI